MQMSEWDVLKNTSLKSYLFENHFKSPINCRWSVRSHVITENNFKVIAAYQSFLCQNIYFESIYYEIIHPVKIVTLMK